MTADQCVRLFSRFSTSERSTENLGAKQNTLNRSAASLPLVELDIAIAKVAVQTLALLFSSQVFYRTSSHGERPK